MEIVCEGPLQYIERIRTSDSNCAEMGDVENNCAMTACAVFGEGPLLVRKGHVPAAKRHHFGADRTMDSIEWRKAISHAVTLVSNKQHRAQLVWNFRSDRSANRRLHSFANLCR